MLNFFNKNMKWVIMKTDVKINVHISAVIQAVHNVLARNMFKAKYSSMN